MKKRKNKFGLKEIVLGGLITVGALFPSFINAQEKILTKQIKPEETNLILKKELGIDIKKNITLSEAQELYSKPSTEKSVIENSAKSTVAHPEWYQHPGFKAIALPYCRPNIQLFEGRDSTDWRGSGDANRDNKVNSEDPISIMSGTYVSSRTSDFNLDGAVTNVDAERLDSALAGQKEINWTYMGAQQKLEESRKRQNIDTSNHFVDPYYRDCTDYSFSHSISLRGAEDWQNSPHYDPEYGENAVENIPYYRAVFQTSTGTWHEGGAIFIGTDSGNLDDQNPLDRFQWYIFDTSRRDEYEAIWVQPGDFNMALTTKLSIEAYIKYPEEIAQETWGMENLIEFDIVNGETVNVSTNSYLIPFNPASSNEEITMENVPESVIVNYQSNIDLSGYESQMPDTAYAKSNLPTSLEGIVSAIIPLDEEHPEIHYKKQITYKASTGYKDSIIIRDIIVEDISPAEITNLPVNRELNYSTNLDLDNYVIPENLNVVDNSGLESTLEKSTYSTQIIDGTINQVKFTQIDSIKVTDYFGNISKYGITQQVDDIEAPSGNLSSYYVQRQSGQSPEAAAKSLVENVYDNSELPVDTFVTNTTGNYYDITLKDIAGNEKYLGNVQVDNPVGIETEPLDLENKCLTVFPNPNPHTIRYTPSNSGKTEVSIYDISGREMMKNIYSDFSNQAEVQYNFSELSQGIYVVKVNSEVCQDSKKVIVDGRK
jgi:hypothetical protein